MSARAQVRGVPSVARLAPYVVASTPLALGGATPASQAWIVTLVGLLALAGFATARERTTISGTSLVLVGALGAIALIALQLVPLACGIVDGISGDGRGRFLLEVARELPAARRPVCRISMDPGATFGALAISGGFLASVLVGASSAHRTRSARDVVRALAFSGGALAFITFAHAMVSATSVYGLHRPVYAGTAIVAPLLNGNHLALLASLGFLASGHLVLTERRRGLRIAAAIGAALDAALVILTHSRGGFVSLVLALTAVAFLDLPGARRGERRSIRALALTGLALCVGLAAAVEWRLLVGEFESAPYKSGLIRSALAAATSAGFLGYGRGAFAAGFAPRTDEAARAMVPENLVAQWTTEFGLVPGTLLLVALVVPTVLGLRAGRRSSSRLACAAVGIALAHDLGDFALELPGLVCTIGLALGAGVARLGHEATIRLPRLATVATGVALLSIPIGTAGSYGRDLETTYRELARSDETAVSRRILETSLVAHPLEPTLFVQLAALEVGRPSNRVVRWANLALRRAPRWSSTHLVLADHFFRRGRSSQALAELAIAAPTNARAVARRVCAEEPRLLDPRRIARVLPDRQDVVEMANVLRACMSPIRFVATIEAAIEAGRRDPSLERLAVEATSAASGREAADARARIATERHPRDPSLAVVGAWVAIARGDGPAALSRAERARALGAPTSDVESLVARGACLTHDQPTLDRALRALREEADAGRIDADFVPVIEADCAASAHAVDAELEAIGRALEANPRPTYLVRLEAVARAAGLAVRADQALARLCREFPDEARCVAQRKAD